MKKVFLRFYATANLGDDLFAKLVTERYADEFYSAQGGGHYRFRGYASNLNLRDDHYISLLRRAGHWFPTLWLRSLIRNKDLLLYVGGSIFIENDNISRWRGEEHFYSRLKVPYYFIGCNFGPYKNPEFVSLVRRILSRAADACFRDKASGELFSDLGNVRVATDLAFTLDPIPYTTSSQRKVVISVLDARSRFGDEKGRAYEVAIARSVESLIRQDFDVTLMSFCAAEGDERALKEILTEIDDTTRPQVQQYLYDGDLEEALRVIGSAEIVVGSRFHATVLGFVLGKKVLPLIYSAKTMNLLSDLNYEGPLVNIPTITDTSISSIDFSRLQHFDVSEERSKAFLQYEQLDKVLTRRLE